MNLAMRVDVASLRSDSSGFREQTPSSPSTAPSDPADATPSIAALLDTATTPDVAIPQLRETLQGWIAHPEAAPTRAEITSLRVAVLRALSGPLAEQAELSEVATLYRQWMQWRFQQHVERKWEKWVRGHVRAAEYEELRERRRALVNIFVRLRCAGPADSPRLFECQNWSIRYPDWARRYDRQRTGNRRSDLGAGRSIEAWLAAQMAQMTWGQRDYLRGEVARVARERRADALNRREPCLEPLNGGECELDAFQSRDVEVGSHESEDLYDP